jgi:hypothetical protein
MSIFSSYVNVYQRVTYNKKVEKQLDIGMGFFENTVSSLMSTLD